jgi:2-dehydro-3-deoxy-D-arabinonate dehydratase
MKLYRTQNGLLLQSGDAFFPLEALTIDDLINHADLKHYLESCAAQSRTVSAPQDEDLLAPVGTQEIWASGVTYERSREGRKEEAKEAGGGDFYSRVYQAERPELFFKACGWRAVGPGDKIRIRADSKWSVPEPELVLVVNNSGSIVGYTVGNDVSSRDIEGENPLYLPQAKVYDRSCAIGPCILVSDQPLSRSTGIEMAIERAGRVCYSGTTTLAQMKRSAESLVKYLTQELSFPAGLMLFTGTGVVPPSDFKLLSGDTVKIRIPPIGELVNEVE